MLIIEVLTLVINDCIIYQWTSAIHGFRPFSRSSTCKYQRWSRGHKALDQGKGHKKNPGQGQGQPLSRPTTGMLEVKAKERTKETGAMSVLQKKVF